MDRRMIRFWKSKKSAAPGPSDGLAAELADEDVRGAVEGIRRFREQFADDRAFYKQLAGGQHPKLLWIGCSDSRIVPDTITNSDPGSLFVVRNIAKSCRRPARGTTPSARRSSTPCCISTSTS
jgi:hypothetical protein